MLDVLQSRTLHLEAGRGVTRDNDNKVVSWESVPDENGNSYVASQGAGGIDYINQSSYFNYLPTLSFNGTGHLINTDFDGLSLTNDFTRIIVLSHDLTGGSDNNVAFNDGVGGSVQYYSSGRLYSYSANGSNYARVDGTFNSANQYQPLILTHLLDSSGANNNAKVKVRVNGETKSVTSFIGSQQVTSGGTGFSFSHSGSGYRWKGDIAEVYLFDRRLSDVEIRKVEDYLKIKYGITKLCQSPNTPPEGYVYNSCNTDLENLAASECSISCAAGFSASRFFTPYVTCSGTGEDFKFYGCFPDNENSRSPPSFVTTDHVGHWDTFNGITLNADGKVSSWTSYPIVAQSNATPSLSSVNQLATYEMNNEHFGNNPVIYFSGDDYFENASFKSLANKTEFTRVIVTRASATGNKFIYDDNSTGYDSRFYSGGLITKVKLGSSGYGNYSGSQTDLVNQGSFISVSRFDGNAGTNAERLDYRINGEQITFNSFNAAIDTVTADGTGITIGSKIDGTQNWTGHIAEVILFDRRLSDAEVIELEAHLKRRWGKDNLCKKPSDYSGYNIDNCDFSFHGDELLSAGECNLTCAAGYRQDNFEVVAASCQDGREEMMFHGCYPDDATFKNDEPNLISKYNDFYFDPAVGVTVDGSNKILSIETRQNSSGETYTFTPYQSSDPTALLVTSENLNQSPALRFTLSDNHLNHENFTDWRDVTESTYFIANYTTESSYRRIPFSTSISGSPFWYNHDSKIYVRANRIGSAYTNITTTSGKMGKPYIHMGVVDRSGSSILNTDKLRAYHNGAQLSFTVNDTQVKNPVEANDFGTNNRLTIGNTSGDDISTYRFIGDVGEIIRFNRSLRQPEIDAVQSYLLRKYGVTKTCTLPDSYTWYDVTNCNVANHPYDDALTEGECSVTCSAGYSSSRSYGH